MVTLSAQHAEGKIAARSGPALQISLVVLVMTIAHFVSNGEFVSLFFFFFSFPAEDVRGLER